ncbi:MAG: esterase/lipase family protein [Azospira sp.]|jgi:pimeloyl-ACP methyl ester carboxylesterase
MGTQQAGRPLDTSLDAKGRETTSAVFESPGKTDEMYIGPKQAIPIVFVPGIMGSPLIATGNNVGLWKKQGKWAWNPDDAVGWVVGGYGGLEPDQRRLLLDPSKTKAVETPADADVEQLKKFCASTSMPWQEAARRGWGSVMITSYGPILNHLENQLRFIFYRGKPYPGTYSAIPSDPGAWGQLKGYQKLAEDDLRKAAAWRFPVYAVGYNWTNSNGDAADYLKRRIDAIRSDCRERLKLKCDKVILVTHSMGGLVARMCAKRNPGDILGVVHGVQPAIGAATAYARVRAGWDSNTHLSAPLASLESAVGAWALGSSGAEVSAVFAGGAGPLELLPNHLYGKGWLKVQYGSGTSAETLFSLPENDPYEEIYKEQSRWWRLIHPSCLVNQENKANTKSIKKEWVKYVKELDKAKTFHYELGNYYHPHTYAHCGADTGQQAWHRITWRLEPLREISSGLWSNKPNPESARNAVISTDLMRGSCEIRDPQSAGSVWVNRGGVGVTAQSQGSFYRAWLSDKDDAGDATVPAHSGLAPRTHVPFFAQMRGFEHQGSYKDGPVQAVTLYSLISLACKAEKPA